jgi:hypothetical protein
VRHNTGADRRRVEVATELPSSISPPLRPRDRKFYADVAIPAPMVAFATSQPEDFDANELCSGHGDTSGRTIWPFMAEIGMEPSVTKRHATTLLSFLLLKLCRSHGNRQLLCQRFGDVDRQDELHRGGFWA